MEILRIAVPATLALAADPIASLIDTAFIGHLGTHIVWKIRENIWVYNRLDSAF